MTRSALLAACSIAIAACADRGGTPATAVDASAALARALAADEAGDERTRDESLRAAAQGEGEPARRATTWLASIALVDGDPVAAEARLTEIETRFEGRPVDAHGHEVSLARLAEAIADDAASVARAKVEGLEPDAAAARTVISAGRRALRDAKEGLEEERAGLDAAEAYVAVGDGPVALAGLVDDAARGKGPIVVVVSDHFELGNDILPSVLRRWSRGVRVASVGLLVGKTRLGIRRLRATPEEETAAIEARAKEIGLVWAGATPTKDGALRRLGIDPTVATVLVIAGDGRLLGRLSGKALDPRPLDPLVASLGGGSNDDGR